MVYIFDTLQQIHIIGNCYRHGVSTNIGFITLLAMGLGYVG